jgi:hypothetical protein
LVHRFRADLASSRPRTAERRTPPVPCDGAAYCWNNKGTLVRMDLAPATKDR